MCVQTALSFLFIGFLFISLVPASHGVNIVLDF